MFDFFQFIYELRHKPLGFIVLAALVFIVDRFGRKFITSQVKRLFRVDDKSDFHHYVQNQRRIESKLDAIMRKEGISWSAHTLPPDSRDTVTKRGRPFSQSSVVLSHVRAAKQYINWRLKRMSNINKGILLPLLSAIALFVKSVWGYEIGDEQINMYADLILYVIMFIGIFIKPKKDNMPELDDME